jgi:hypothetical protein
MATLAVAMQICRRGIHPSKTHMLTRFVSMAPRFRRNRNLETQLAARALRPGGQHLHFRCTPPREAEHGSTT